ncbi:MAG: Gfo/Idh/MocA family oxidoreductase [Bacteroidia bacterium]|nr:Gfo/Idh/MocA family oxidoreductase [Bacteroidia bacterium]MDW8334784.1 Gfo/Idh/MocA family oxidoreductase [Bacteroidia bacterium]
MIRFALYGCGFAGEKHITAIQNVSGAQLYAVVDCNLDRKRLLPDLPFFSDWNDFIDCMSPPEVVSVCTPNGLHISHAFDALSFGCNVLIEKPMGLHFDECNRLNEFAANLGLKVFCVLQNRYSPPIVWLKSLLNSGILGRIFLVSVRCFWNRDDRYYRKDSWRGTLALDGGPLFTQFSHFMDILYYLFGLGKNYHAKFNNFNHRHNTEFEDSGHVWFEFENGAECNLQYSTCVWDSNLESSITIISENGSVIIGGQYMNTVSVCKIKDYKTPELDPAPPANCYPGFSGSAGNHVAVFENVVRALTGKEHSGIDGREGANVVKMIEDIYRLR